jgi:hypothetical protein
MRRILNSSTVFALIVAFTPSIALAQKSKGTRFWNLTANTVTGLQLSPAGKETWGADQCKNDRDGTVDHDERLRITGVQPGRYDVKLADKTRVCIVRNIEVKDGGIFTIDEKQLTDCHQ